ncbi:unnamed protein product [Pleuronectes platessa]|uniref:Uncharacterized protein n=1 Tax=Pleuronectes platessa TaxID=8262 RepID=A0A9N7UIP1_PLEPL|nr:unnamed protein product [Pleuronectes platessa]
MQKTADEADRFRRHMSRASRPQDHRVSSTSSLFGPASCTADTAVEEESTSGLGRGWLVTAAGRDTPASNSTNHHCYISLVISSLRRQIIPSSMDACVPHCSALRPPTCQDLQASLHPASPAFSCLVSNKLCSIPINYHSVSASGSDP